MFSDINKQLIRDLGDFLFRHQIEKIQEIPLEMFVTFEFPRVDQKSEHLELSELVAKLMRFERLWALQQRLHGRLDESDLVRNAPDPAIIDWRNTVAGPALIRLALLDCRERLARLVRLSGEEEKQAAVERLMAKPNLESPSTLGELNALVSWLAQEVADVRALTSQIVGFPVHLLPPPGWANFERLQGNSVRMEGALEESSHWDSLDYLESFVARHKSIEASLGGLSHYGSVLDCFYPGFASVFHKNCNAKHHRIRRLLERALEYASVNQEKYDEDFPDFSVIVEDAFCLVDSSNPVWEFIGSEIFKPEDWRENRDALRPLFLKTPHMSFWLRSGLIEMVHAFVFGHWVAVQALSRALLEQAIKVNHVKLRIDLEEPGSRHSKSLERLIDEVKDRFPQIESEMDIVRRYGNKVLHGSDQVDQVDRVQNMVKLRRDATQSIESLYAVLEMLPKLSR